MQQGRWRKEPAGGKSPPVNLVGQRPRAEKENKIRIKKNL